jgi:predicted DNA binding CopG/RHH family protein
MDKAKIAPEELDLLESYEHDEWQSVKDFSQAQHYRSAAQATLRKDAQVNIRK